jgi:hypothetical protein
MTKHAHYCPICGRTTFIGYCPEDHSETGNDINLCEGCIEAGEGDELWKS